MASESLERCAMAEAAQYLTIAGQATYRIRVQGAIQRSWCESFTGMRVAFRKVSSPDALTILTGDVQDQAQLLGLLNSLYDLGLPLVSVQWLRKKVDSTVKRRARAVPSRRARGTTGKGE
jgi:hypothetical protein